MSTVLHRLVPDGLNLFRAVTNAVVVAGTLYVLDGSLGYAAASAAVFLGLHLATDLADAVVGDYAGNALFGVLVLSGAVYFATLGAVWFPVALVAVGGWLVLDGVQHLRYGVTRDDIGVSHRHDGSVLTGLPRALLSRLLEPALLARRQRGGVHGDSTDSEP